MKVRHTLKQALGICEELVSVEGDLHSLSVSVAGHDTPLVWLAWAADERSPECDESYNEMLADCDKSETTRLIRDQLLLPRVEKLFKLLATDVKAS